MPTIASFEVSDPPELWARLGFRVSNGVVAVGGTEYRLGRRGSGIARWSLVDVDLGPGAGDVDGLPTAAPDLPTPGEDPPARHPNGVTGLDHVVVATPDHGRTVAAFEAIGLELRRVRATAGHGAPMRQAFFRLGPVILEVVGPDEPGGRWAGPVLRAGVDVCEPGCHRRAARPEPWTCEARSPAWAPHRHVGRTGRERGGDGVHVGTGSRTDQYLRPARGRRLVRAAGAGPLDGCRLTGRTQRARAGRARVAAEEGRSDQVRMAEGNTERDR